MEGSGPPGMAPVMAGAPHMGEHDLEEKVRAMPGVRGAVDGGRGVSRFVRGVRLERWSVHLISFFPHSSPMPRPASGSR